MSWRHSCLLSGIAVYSRHSKTVHSNISINSLTNKYITGHFHTGLLNTLQFLSLPMCTPFPLYGEHHSVMLGCRGGQEGDGDTVTSSGGVNTTPGVDEQALGRTLELSLNMINYYIFAIPQGMLSATAGDFQLMHAQFCCYTMLYSCMV